MSFLRIQNSNAARLAMSIQRGFSACVLLSIGESKVAAPTNQLPTPCELHAGGTTIDHAMYPSRCGAEQNGTLFKANSERRCRKESAQRSLERVAQHSCSISSTSELR
jgi:hypothetical protein